MIEEIIIIFFFYYSKLIICFRFGFVIAGKKTIKNARFLEYHVRLRDFSVDITFLTVKIVVNHVL